jgi:PPOX class probable F420-dependent enzyme
VAVLRHDPGMNATATLDAAPAGRPGYDPDAAATARRVLPMLGEERVVWLSTVRPDGTPHLVPTWFLWDGDALLVWSKPNAVKVRNLRANPRLMVAVGDPDADFNVGLVEAEAKLAAEGASAIPDAFFEKYAAELAATGLDRAAFRATYGQAIRIAPRRFVAWHGLTTPRDDRAAPAAGSRLSGITTAVAGWLERMAAGLRGGTVRVPPPAAA